MVGIDSGTPKTIPLSETFGIRKVFYDKADEFEDVDYWKDYNILEPTESLEKAVDKLLKRRVKR